MGSLPSDDMTVQDSVVSVDWKFDVLNADSARVRQSSDDEGTSEKKKNDFINEEKLSETDEIEEEDDHESDDDSSSDINTRDEMEDLESCPDGVGQSASMSEDVNLRAEAITEELLQLILDDYK